VRRRKPWSKVTSEDGSLPRLFEALAIPSHALRFARDSLGRRADVRPGMTGLQGAGARLCAECPARDDRTTKTRAVDFALG
jgi:hypothetical protein